MFPIFNLRKILEDTIGKNIILYVYVYITTHKQKTLTSVISK